MSFSHETEPNLKYINTPASTADYREIDVDAEGCHTVVLHVREIAIHHTDEHIERSGNFIVCSFIYISVLYASECASLS